MPNVTIGLSASHASITILNLRKHLQEAFLGAGPCIRRLSLALKAYIGL